MAAKLPPTDDAAPRGGDASALLLSHARLMFERMPSACLLTDTQLRVADWNPAAEQVFGHGRADVLGQPALELVIPPAGRALVRDCLDRVARGEETACTLETTVRGGETILCEWTSTPLFDAAGRFAGAMSMAVDVTDRQRSRVALRESEERFNRLADSMPALVWMSDPDGHCVFVNRRWLEFTGRSLEDVLGRGYPDSIHPDDREEVLGAEAAAFAQRADFSKAYRLRRADGEFRWFLDTAAPRPGRDGAYLGYIGTLVDITERMRLAQELVEARDRAEEASRAKSDFLASMSHELRTPLNAVIGFSEILKDELLGPLGSPRYVEYCGDIHDSGLHLLRIINDILDLSKMEVGKFRLREATIDLGEVCHSCLRLLQVPAEAAGLTLALDASEALPPIRADEIRIKQIVANLLSNAVKFTPSGGRVTLGARIDGEGIVLSVSDTGIGMRAEDIPRALERFHQIDTVFGRRQEGTGLGLPLSKHLAELHGGRLEIESRVGAGTTVRVILPAERVVQLPAHARRR